jgi:hypothetical protein
MFGINRRSQEVALALPSRAARSTRRRLATGLALAMVAVAGAASPTSATMWPGPLNTSIDSGTTVCETITYGTAYLGWSTTVRQVRVNATTVRPTMRTPSFASIRRTIELWSLEAGSSQWYRQVMPPDHARPTVVTSTNWSTQPMFIPTRADFRGQITTTEKIEFLDSYGRVLYGGTWGPYWESSQDLSSVRYAYGTDPTPYSGCRFW